MEQKITIKIAGRPYPLKANSPEHEELIRKAADELNRKVRAYQENHPNKGTVDHIAFAALNVCMYYINLKNQMNDLMKEEEVLVKELEGYLENIDKNSR